MMCLTGVDTLIAYGCRAGGDVSRQPLIFNGRCPAGQVIRIQSAHVAYHQNRKTCPRLTSRSWSLFGCWRSIINDDAIANCNGQRVCSISQISFIYPQGRRACYWSEYANYVYIVYHCRVGNGYVFDKLPKRESRVIRGRHGHGLG